MLGAKHMIRRAEYRKAKESALFKKVIEWAEGHGEPLVVEIVKRAYNDDDAEHWLTLHPTSSYTGLIERYWEIVCEERQMTGNERRLLKKKLDAYGKRLLD
jgi:hypothetical protein